MCSRWLVFAILTLNHVRGICYDAEEDIEIEEQNPVHYEFKYGVKDLRTGDIKDQWEVRKGNSVRGRYSLVEPDGTVRTVKYTADPGGFNAVVTREGRAEHQQAPQPRRQIPRPRASHSGPPSEHPFGVANTFRVPRYATPQVPSNHNPVYAGIRDYRKIASLYRSFREQNLNPKKLHFDYGINEYFDNGYVALSHGKTRGRQPKSRLAIDESSRSHRP